jgi:hypothetical protein
MSRPGLVHRLAVALLVGLFACTLSLSFPVSDMQWAMCYARELLSGADPYSTVCQRHIFGMSWPAAPLTLVLLVLPFAAAFSNDVVAAAVAVGLSYGLLTWALLRRRAFPCLVVLLSFPSLQACFLGTFSPVLLVAALLPACLPVTLIKPHIGLPIAITHMNRRRALACVLFAGISLVVDPTWPLRWLPLTLSYSGYIPCLTVPGIVLLAALWRWGDGWHNQDMRYLMLCMFVPQKAPDALVLVAALRTPLEMGLWAASSWLVFGAELLFPQRIELAFATHGWIATSFLYVPAGILLLIRRMRTLQNNELWS